MIQHFAKCLLLFCVVTAITLPACSNVVSKPKISIHVQVDNDRRHAFINAIRDFSDDNKLMYREKMLKPGEKQYYLLMENDQTLYYVLNTGSVRYFYIGIYPKTQTSPPGELESTKVYESLKAMLKRLSFSFTKEAH